MSCLGHNAVMTVRLKRTPNSSVSNQALYYSNCTPQVLHLAALCCHFLSMKPLLKQIMFGTILFADAYLFLELGIFGISYFSRT